MAKKSDSNKKPGRRPVKDTNLVPKGYEKFLGELKEQIRTARLRAAIGVNRELIELYWQIGKSLVERQRSDGWGKSVVERLARDLQTEFPGMSGFSPRNVWRMRAFYLAYTEEVRKLPRPVAELDGENLPRAVAEIPWGHNSDLLDKVKNPVERLWYAHAAVENGWSRSVLVHWVESDLYQRQGKAQTNFERPSLPCNPTLQGKRSKIRTILPFSRYRKRRKSKNSSEGSSLISVSFSWNSGLASRSSDSRSISKSAAKISTSTCSSITSSFGPTW